MATDQGTVITEQQMTTEEAEWFQDVVDVHGDENDITTIRPADGGTTIFELRAKGSS